MKIDSSRIPDELKKEVRWLLWRQEEVQGRQTKVPYSLRGSKASSIDPGTWGTFYAAMGMYETSQRGPKPYSGIGFALGGGFAGLEIDNCIDIETAALVPDAEEYVRRLDSYTEISPSGTGIHVLVKHDGSLSGGRKVLSPKPPIKEIGAYCDGRYYTVTGTWMESSPSHLNDATAEFGKIMRELGLRPGVEEWTVRGETGEPPMPLSGEDLATWRGERPVRKGDGDIDRSMSLIRLVRMLRYNKVPVTRLQEIIQERDEALGWRKFVDRTPDNRDRRIEEMIDLVYKEREYKEPEVHADDGTYTFDYSDGVRIRMEYIQESARENGLQAEVTITKDGAPVHWARLVLSSSTGQEDIVRRLAGKDRAAQDFWRKTIMSACLITTKAYRVSGEVVEAVPRRSEGTPYLVYPVIPDRAVTVLFGDGGVGKGWLCMALAVGVATNKDTLTFPPVPGLAFQKQGKVLYVDAEDNRATFENRLLAIWNGLELPETSKTGIIYHRLEKNILEEIPRIKTLVQDEHVVLVIVDSYAMAVGKEPEGSEAATTTMKALRNLNEQAATLVIAHVTKEKAENGGAFKPYGSVIISNSARAGWEMAQMREDANWTDVVLYHRKTNASRKHRPLEYRIDFTSEGEGAEERTMAVRVLSRERIANADVDEVKEFIQRIGRATTEEVSEHIGKPRSTTQHRLIELRDRGFVRENVGGGRGNPTYWEWVGEAVV